MSSLFLLDPFLNNYIHQLSGGTKRRLHAAIALIGKIFKSETNFSNCFF
jgi:ABC-type dipeptide/oligopeptide/nickel transport system ATPase component